LLKAWGKSAQVTEQTFSEQSGGEKLVGKGNKKKRVKRGHLAFGGGILKRAG